jgi:DNA-binding MarR family transcriptional regulator
MDAYSADAANLTYFEHPPILLVASSERALARAEPAIHASGLRVGARMLLEHAPERIDRQASSAAVWVEVDADGGAPMDELLDLITTDVRNGRYGAVISVTHEALDPVAARICEPAIELIAGADDAERVAALATVIGSRELPVGISDVASDRSAERLRQLSDEVSRIAATLARLSAGPGAPPRTLEPAIAVDVPPLSAETVRNVIRARRLRARYFAEDLFADPAWDMLLDLLQAEIAQLRVPVSSLCIAAAVPATTALRWLKTMVANGLFVRRADPHDGRRVFVELAPEASQALRRYFADVGHVAVI